MPSAFILINTELGCEPEVLDNLKKIEEIEEALMVYGVYDIVAKIQADTLDKLKEIITFKIRRLDKIKSTLTTIITEKQ